MCCRKSVPKNRSGNQPSRIAVPNGPGTRAVDQTAPGDCSRSCTCRPSLHQHRGRYGSFLSPSVAICRHLSPSTRPTRPRKAAPLSSLRGSSRSCFAGWQQVVDELRADSVVGCQLPTTGRGAWKAAQRAARIAAQQELRPPQTGQRRPAGRPKHRKSGLRCGDRKYATQGGRGAITLVECCGGESRAWDKTVRVEVMTSGNSRMRWACGLSPARETGGAESGLQVGLRLCGCGRVLETLEIRKLITSCHTY